MQRITVILTVPTGERVSKKDAAIMADTLKKNLKLTDQPTVTIEDLIEDESAIPGLSHEITFGKFKGTSIGFVIDNNPGYIVWAHENVDHFKVSQEILAKAKYAASHMNTNRPYRNAIREDYGHMEAFEHGSRPIDYDDIPF